MSATAGVAPLAGQVPGPRRVVRALVAWLSLAAGLAALGAMAWAVVHHEPVFVTLRREYGFEDLFGRLGNLTALRRTGDIYANFGHLAFTYPPGAIFFFWPLQWIPVGHLPLVWTALSLAALAGSAFIVLRVVGAPRLGAAGAACWVAVGAAALFPEVTECLTYGQTAAILLLLVLADEFCVPPPARGVLVGVAAAVKVYPAVFILAWLARRHWRSAATAIATAAAVTGAAAWRWWASAHSFVHRLLTGGGEYRHLTETKNVKESASVVALFQRPPFSLHTLSPREGTAVCLAVVALGVVASHRLWRRGLAVGAATVLLIVGAVGAPVAWDHYFVFLPLLAAVAWEAGAASPLGVVALTALAAALVPWINFRAPRAPVGWSSVYSTVAQNALLATTLVVVAAAALRRAPARRRTGGPRDAPEPAADAATGASPAAARPHSHSG